MAIAAIDTHQQVKELIKVGFTEPQAEAQVKFFLEIAENSLVTKADLKKEIQAVRNDLEKLASTLTYRMGYLMVLSTVFIVGFLKYLL